LKAWTVPRGEYMQVPGNTSVQVPFIKKLTWPSTI
jgi:hypothetical protein